MARKKAAKKKAKKAAPKKKGVVDAGKKRSMARRFNDALKPSVAKPEKLDKRTAKRLARYKTELKAGKKGDKNLSPLDVATRINELLNHGEKLGDLKKLAKPRKVDIDIDQLVGILKEMHPVYGYRPDAYRFAGVSDAALLAAGIIDKLPARRGPKPAKKKAAAKKRAPAKKKAARRKGTKK